MNINLTDNEQNLLNDLLSKIPKNLNQQEVLDFIKNHPINEFMFVYLDDGRIVINPSLFFNFKYHYYYYDEFTDKEW